MALWVRSPCVAICKLDPQEKYCLGCFRLIGEISNWAQLTKEEKTQVIETAKNRKQAYNEAKAE